MQEFISPEAENVRDQANAWVARFAPLVMTSEVLTADEIKARIQTCSELQNSSNELKAYLPALNGVDDQLISTTQRAMEQLDSIETDLRRQLGKLSPGDPQGVADLDSINDKLAERLARKEMGLTTDLEVPEVLEMKVAPGNKAAGAGLGVFGLGWNSFTAVHATFMIGGMYKAFGLAALGLLAFYAIFFMVGIGMWIAAFNTACAESIVLNGRQLTIRKSLGPWNREKVYQLGADTTASIGEMEMAQVTGSRSNKRPTPVVQLYDVDGNAIGLASTATAQQRDQVKDKINAYLKQRG